MDVIASITKGQTLLINASVAPPPLDPLIGHVVVLFRNSKYSQPISPIKPHDVDISEGDNIILEQPYSILTTREVVEVYYECVEFNGETTIELIYMPNETTRRVILRVDGIHDGHTFPLSARVKGIR